VVHKRHITLHFTWQRAVVAVVIALLLGVVATIAYGLYRHWAIEEWTAFATVVGAVVTTMATIGTFAVVLLTRQNVQAAVEMVAANLQMVEEMKEGRLAQARPLILLDFVRENSQIVLRIGNYGGPASNVRFSFQPALLDSHGRNVAHRPLLGEGLPLLTPGEEQ